MGEARGRDEFGMEDVVGAGGFMLHPVRIIKPKSRMNIFWVMESLYSRHCTFRCKEQLGVVYFPQSKKNLLFPA